MSVTYTRIYENPQPSIVGGLAKGAGAAFAGYFAQKTKALEEQRASEQKAKEQKADLIKVLFERGKLRSAEPGETPDFSQDGVGYKVQYSPGEMESTTTAQYNVWKMSPEAQQASLVEKMAGGYGASVPFSGQGRDVLADMATLRMAANVLSGREGISDVNPEYDKVTTIPSKIVTREEGRKWVDLLRYKAKKGDIQFLRDFAAQHPQFWNDFRSISPEFGALEVGVNPLPVPTSMDLQPGPASPYGLGREKVIAPDQSIHGYGPGGWY